LSVGYRNKIGKKFSVALLSATVLCTSVTTGANAATVTDALIEGAKLCTRPLPRYERQYGIPTHLLSAIASTESGRYHKGLNIKVPWPWTINAEGKGYFFSSKQEAIASVNKLRAQGVKSIDVGCMQVNLMHHPQAFASLDEAFDPEHNVAYAASFLRSLYQETNSWKEAAADYHSRTHSRGTEYAGHVYNSWYNIIDKLRMAKVEVPHSSVAAMNDMKRAVQIDKSLNGDRPYGAKTITVSSNQKNGSYVKASPNGNASVYIPSVQRLPEQRGKQVAAYQPPRMNSIQVSSSPRRDNSIIVVNSDSSNSTRSKASTGTITTSTPAPNVTVTNTNAVSNAHMSNNAAPNNVPANTSAVRTEEAVTVAHANTAPIPQPVSTTPKVIYVNDSIQQASNSVVVKKSGPTFIFHD
jgi:hypothetical protein